MHLERKSDLTEEFIKFVKNIRAMYGKDHDYELFQRVLLDSAGEQREDNAEFIAGVMCFSLFSFFRGIFRRAVMGGVAVATISSAPRL